jgi:hypothetical protein
VELRLQAVPVSRDVNEGPDIELAVYHSLIELAIRSATRVALSLRLLLRPFTWPSPKLKVASGGGDRDRACGE